MNKNIKITTALSAAASALLGVDAPLAQETQAIGTWDFKMAALYYTEPDRVDAIEPAISARRQIDTDESLTLKLTLDSLTGASASGAVPSSDVQTYTRPSGSGSYTIGANETPLDDTFLDTRVALNANWERPLGRLLTMNLGANISKEYDYTSLGVNALLSRDFNKRNTTVTAGISAAFDDIDPEGGVPVAFGVMRPAEEEQPRAGSSDDKTTADFLMGVTQVIDANSLFQLNYSFSQADGYQTDPYKVLSVIDASTGSLIIEDAAIGLPRVVAENRPDERTKHGLYGQYKRNIGGDVLDLSYRFMTDDWGIDSHTVDVKYRWDLGSGYLQPHIRYYQQSAADFYRGFLLDGQTPVAGDISSFASADYRLGDFTGVTTGLEYGRKGSQPWSIAIEYYLQSGDEPDGKFGALNDQELYPDVDALMFRIIYDI